MSSGGHVAIVTGAAQGIGLAISNALLKEGYKVCVADINVEKGKESVASLRRLYGDDCVIFFACDVSSEQQFQDLFTEAIKEFGQVDVLVNNAGIADEFDPRRTVEINLMGPIIGCETALNCMSTSKGSSGGIVVSVASIVGLVPYARLPVYTATKHAVVGLTRSYGNEYYLKENGIMFMGICPLRVRTSLSNTSKSRVRTKDEISPEYSETMEPEYVAEGVLKLLHEKQNGSILAVLPKEFVYVGYPEEVKNILLC